MPSKLSVVRPTVNGKKPLAKVAPKPSLSAQVDQLAELRGLLRRATAEEKALTAEVVAALKATNRDRADGLSAVAILGTRTNLKVDPQLFLEAVGQKGYAAISVSVTAAREFMGEQDLNAIAEPIPTPVLRVEPKAEVAR